MRISEIRHSLTEDYQDRVDMIVAKLRTLAPIMSNDLTSKILQAAQEINAVELQMGERSRKEFIRDIIKAAKSEGLVKRATVGPRTNPIKEMAEKLARQMPSMAGDVFPDGDPNDLIGDWFRKNRISEDTGWSKIFPMAERILCHDHKCKSWNDFLADMWDDFAADARHDAEHGHPDRLEMIGGSSAKNPWR